ncbi:MAG: hypothetical protein M5U14_07900 [Acidimicrobiia bacterium]|nr:hypothetical protein [Acidimicrobiia bacterium]
MNEVGDNLRAIVVPLLDDLDPQVREDFIDVIRHVWNSLLLQWARGRFDMAEMADALERTTRLILPCHLPGSDGRRSS